MQRDGDQIARIGLIDFCDEATNALDVLGVIGDDQRVGGGKRTHHIVRRDERTHRIDRLRCLFKFQPKNFSHNLVIGLTK